MTTFGKKEDFASRKQFLQTCQLSRKS